MSNWSYKSKLSNKCPSGEHEIKINQTPYIGNRKNKSILEMPPLKITNIKYSNDLVLSETLTIPDSYSLKNQIFKDSTGKIIYAIEPGGYRDQASCGCCYAFAIASALGDRYALKYKINNPYLSPAWIVSSYLTGSAKCDEGANTQLVCNWIEKDGNGVKKEYCWPYYILTEGPDPTQYVAPDPLNDTSIIPTNCCADCCSDSTDHKQIFYCAPKSTNYIVAILNGVFNQDPNATIQMIQKEIMTNGPVVSSFSIYKDFYDYWNNRAGSKNFSDKTIYNTFGDIYVRDITTTDSSGQIPGLVFVGGHSVVITGWGVQTDGVQKGLKYWEVRNSWGNTGDNGYCKIAFSSSIPVEQWIQIDVPQYISNLILSGGCISFLPGDLPTQENNYGATNTSNSANPIGYVDYPPIFAPISLPSIIPAYLQPVIRYIVISLIGIVILIYYYYFFKILFSKNVNINLILKIFIILLGLGFAATYTVLGIQEHSFYGLFTYVNKYIK